MAFNIKERGKLTYYFRGESPAFSNAASYEFYATALWQRGRPGGPA